MKRIWKFIRHGGLPISLRFHSPTHPGVSSQKYLCWNWLPKNGRYWGYKEEWYDGPLPGFGFWYFHFYTLWY